MALAALALAGCIEEPTLGAARAPGAPEAADHERVLRLMEQQNRLLAAELEAQRAAAEERAELTRRVEELTRENRELSESMTRLDHEPKPAQITSLVDTSDPEIGRLRAKLVEAGFNPVTLNPAQVRALVRTLKPPRPIDVDSPFAF
jgi:predicted RNase H-like nuclease (RuvC/YqgF family)